MRLQVQPVLHRSAEVLAEVQRGVGRDRSLAVQDLVDASTGLSGNAAS